MLQYVNQIIHVAASKRGSAENDENDRLLWNTGFHFGEWLVPGKDKPGFEACPETAWYIAPFYGYWSVSKLAKIAYVLGKNEDENRYRTLADKMKAAIQEEILPIEHSFSEYMGRYVLALAFHLADGDFYEPYKEKLISLIEERNGCLGTGFLATPYLLRVLDEIGRHDLVKKVIWQDKCPSWLYEVKMGATTIWENWGAVKPDGEPNKISFDHYAFGVVDEYMFENIAGIKPLEPGFRTFAVNPNPDAGFERFERSFVSEAGTIAISFSKNVLRVTVPPNTRACVTWSGKNENVGSGTWIFDEKGVVNQ